MWFNIDTRGHKKAPKRQNKAVGPEDPPRVITSIRNPGWQRVNLIEMLKAGYFVYFSNHTFYKVFHGKMILPHLEIFSNFKIAAFNVLKI